MNTCLCPPCEMSGRFFSSSACYFPCPKHLIWQIFSCQFFLRVFEMQIIFKTLLPLIALHCLFQDLEPYILNGIIKAGRASSLRSYSRIGLTSICSMLSNCLLQERPGEFLIPSGKLLNLQTEDLPNPSVMEPGNKSYLKVILIFRHNTGIKPFSVSSSFLICYV